MIEMDIVVSSKHGLHVRPCSSLVKICSRDSETTAKVRNITENTTYVDCKSMVQVASLRASYGHKLHFVFDGKNPQILAELVADFFSKLD